MILFSTVDPIYYSVSWTVVHAIWQVLLWALVGGVAINIWHSKGASFRFNILLSTVGMIFLTSIGTFYYLFMQNALNIGAEALPYDVVNHSSPTMSQLTYEGSLEANDNSLWSRLTQWISDNVYGIFLIWIIGMVMSLLRLISNVSYVFYLKSAFNFPVEEYWENTLHQISEKLNVNKAIAILESALVRAPIVIGHFKPVILFPIGAINRLDVGEVESILAHELAHIKRNDYMINVLLNISEAIFYFHPAMWWIMRQLNIEREHCCDDLALEAVANPIGYAKSLVAIQEMAFYSPTLAMAFAGNDKKSQLAIRINRLLSKPKRVAHTFEKSVAIVVVTAIIIAFSIAAKPASNDDQSSCLSTPSIKKKGDPHYLKFDNMAILDSLYVPFEVNDGSFNYDDHLHHVEMIVQDRHVISFNLNGLEIVGSDISKFENLIFEILKGKEIVNPEESREQAWADMIIANASSDHFFQKGKKNTITLDANKLVINGRVMEGSIHERYIHLLSENGQALDNNVQYNLTAHVNPDGQVILISKHDAPMPISSPEATGEGISSGADYQRTEDNNNPASNGDSYFSENPFGRWLDEELYKDGYIKKMENFSYMWNTSRMVVDGVEVSVSDRKKYAEKRKAMTGFEITNDFIMTKFQTPD